MESRAPRARSSATASSPPASRRGSESPEQPLSSATAPSAPPPSSRLRRRVTEAAHAEDAADAVDSTRAEDTAGADETADGASDVSDADVGRGGGVVIDTFLFPGCGRSRPPVVITAGERTRAEAVCPAAPTESSARRRNR